MTQHPNSPRRSALNLPLAMYGESQLGIPLRFLGCASECRLLVIAGVHGEEPETTVILSRAIRSCAAEGLVTVAAVPAVNPDGLLLGTRGNGRGVDLNRNFPAANWQPEPVGYRWHVDEEETVRIETGSEPASEPETAALIGLVERLKPEAVIALHAPLACIDDPGKTPLGVWLAEKSGLPLVSDIGYPTPGSMGTWAQENGLPWITWEFPRLSIEELSRDQAPILADILTGAADGLI